MRVASLDIVGKGGNLKENLNKEFVVVIIESYKDREEQRTPIIMMQCSIIITFLDSQWMN